jgi:hypothetical protein
MRLNVPIVICLIACPSLPGCDGATYVEGRVTSEGRPLPNAKVIVIQEGKAEPVPMYVATDGRFGLHWAHEPRPLRMKLKVTHEGFEPYEESFVGNQKFERNVELNPSQAATTNELIPTVQ